MNTNTYCWRSLATTTVLLLAAGAASAQTPCPAPDNCLTNPGFENASLFAPTLPEGWAAPDPQTRFREVGDALSPPAVARSGTRSMEMSAPASATDFRALTTDLVNFFSPGFPFYDAAYDWSSQADIRISGWYYIPSNDPLIGQAAGIKLDAKSGLDAPAANRNQNWATFDPWGGEAPLVQGHTNDEWAFYEATWTFADLEAEVALNADLGFIPYPAFAPGRIKVTIGRWSPDAGTTSGTIFWDDIKLEYVQSGPSCPPCAADYDNNGGVDGGDLAAFFADFEAGETCADVDGNGGVDGGDLGFFFTVFEQGGCE